MLISCGLFGASVKTTLMFLVFSLFSRRKEIFHGLFPNAQNYLIAYSPNVVSEVDVNPPVCSPRQTLAITAERSDFTSKQLDQLLPLLPTVGKTSRLPTTSLTVWMSPAELIGAPTGFSRKPETTLPFNPRFPQPPADQTERCEEHIQRVDARHGTDDVIGFDNRTARMAQLYESFKDWHSGTEQMYQQILADIRRQRRPNFRHRFDTSTAKALVIVFDLTVLAVLRLSITIVRHLVSEIINTFIKYSESI